MDLQLKGKTAVITGGTRGIGRAIAERFAAEGANVAFCARDAERVAAAVKALQAKGVKAFGRPADAADGPALQRFIGEAADALGGIDIFISNASSSTHGTSEREWRAAFDIDMMGAVRACEAAIPHLERAAAAKGDASFLALSSMAATQVGEPDAYGAVKAALMHYAKGMACAYASKKVRFNTISPGTIYDEDGSWGRIRRATPDYYDMALKLNPTGRMGTPEEIAAAAVFLSSPLSAFTSGANIVIDGCMTHRVNF